MSRTFTHSEPEPDVRRASRYAYSCGLSWIAAKRSTRPATLATLAAPPLGAPQGASLLTIEEVPACRSPRTSWSDVARVPARVGDGVPVILPGRRAFIVTPPARRAAPGRRRGGGAAGPSSGRPPPRRRCPGRGYRGDLRPAGRPEGGNGSKHGLRLPWCQWGWLVMSLIMPAWAAGAEAGQLESWGRASR
jgi:hypothetical protein